MYPFIADSAVLVKVTAHLLADIQPGLFLYITEPQNACGNSTGLFGSAAHTVDPLWFLIEFHMVYSNDSTGVDSVSAVG